MRHQFIRSAKACILQLILLQRSSFIFYAWIQAENHMETAENRLSIASLPFFTAICFFFLSKETKP